MRRVVVTGLGVISPIGMDQEALVKNLKAGVCGIDEITSFDTEDLNVKLAAQVRDFDPLAFGLDKKAVRFHLINDTDIAKQYTAKCSIVGYDGVPVTERERVIDAAPDSVTLIEEMPLPSKAKRKNCYAIVRVYDGEIDTEDDAHPINHLSLTIHH